MIGLNIGSGQRRFEGWANLDITYRPPDQIPDAVADARQLPHADNSVDYCCLHHVLEHWGCGEADTIIKECHRVLKPNGSLLVFVPDLEALARRWLSGLIDDFIFNVNVYGAYQGSEFDRHRWGYTEKALIAYLEKLAEWSWVGRFEYRPIRGANIALDWWIAMAEAVK